MRNQKIYLVYSEVLLKKKKENKCKQYEKNYKESVNLFENSYLKLTISSFRWTHTHTHTYREIDSEVSIVQRYATVNEERRNGVNRVNWQMF